jgi:hypothetical protein
LKLTCYVYSYSATPRVLLHQVTIDASNPAAALAHGRNLLHKWKRYGAVNVAIVDADGETLYSLIED